MDFPTGEDFLYLCGSSKHLSIRKRYRCLRRSLLIVMLLITLVPLSLTVGLSFFQYQQLTRQESVNNIRWHTESARRSLEVFLDRLKDSMIVVANTNSLPGLATTNKLDHIFAQLKNKHQGLVDVSIIGPDGIQIAYCGPYNLRGKNYHDSPWYNKALTRTVLISDVFFGFRNMPHFVVAVTKTEQDGRYWVLRASIDIETLDHFLASISTDLAEDIFLVNREGQLQTSSRHYGRITDTFSLTGKINPKGVTVAEVDRGGKNILQSLSTIQGTPWLLVLEQKDYTDRSTWLIFKNQLLGIFVLTAITAAVIIVKMSGSIADQVKDADEFRERMLSETEHTNKLASLGRLAAGVAHEINNPLAIINEKAGLMKDIIELGTDFPLRDKFLKQLSSLEAAVKRARTITHRLLGFARRMDVNLEQLQLNDIVQEVLGFLDKEAMYRDIRLNLDLQQDLPVIRSDHGQLQQIFLNIINNAIDAIGRCGEIKITTRQITPQSVRVELADNGPGIADEILKNIFEPFFTTKKNSEKPGTGLGLSITYGLVKKLGGTIAAASTVGEGTTFIIDLPIHPKQSEPEKNA